MILTGPGAFDPIRVEKSFAELMALTGFSPFDHDSRAREIDERIQHAGLSLADKIEVFKRLAPRAEDSRTGALTGERKEVRMERLLLSAAPEQLPAFKFPLEYDVDYKDFEEYVFHDIDAPDRRARILEVDRRYSRKIGLLRAQPASGLLAVETVFFHRRCPRLVVMIPGACPGPWPAIRHSKVWRCGRSRKPGSRPALRPFSPGAWFGCLSEVAHFTYGRRYETPYS